MPGLNAAGEASPVSPRLLAEAPSPPSEGSPTGNWKRARLGGHGDLVRPASRRCVHAAARVADPVTESIARRAVLRNDAMDLVLVANRSAGPNPPGESRRVRRQPRGQRPRRRAVPFDSAGTSRESHSACTPVIVAEFAKGCTDGRDLDGGRELARRVCFESSPPTLDWSGSVTVSQYS